LEKGEVGESILDDYNDHYDGFSNGKVTVFEPWAEDCLKGVRNEE
jgi:hypothetical protein